MSSEKTEHRHELKRRVVDDFKKYLAVAVFLFFFFGSVTTYRRLILAEYQIGYLEYGWGLVKALVLAKVILIGEIFHLGKRFEGRRMIWVILGKTLLFGLFILAFALCEHVVSALFHHRAMKDEFTLTRAQGDELLARVQLEVVALLPLFAFKELDRVLGEGKMASLLFGPEGQVPPRERSAGGN
ncbi:MAG: hypothetical protein ACXWLA_04565 [Myxococcaceae bacterium]